MEFICISNEVHLPHTSQYFTDTCASLLLVWCGKARSAVKLRTILPFGLTNWTLNCRQRCSRCYYCLHLQKTDGECSI